MARLFPLLGGVFQLVTHGAVNESNRDYLEVSVASMIYDTCSATIFKADDRAKGSMINSEVYGELFLFILTIVLRQLLSINGLEIGLQATRMLCKFSMLAQVICSFQSVILTLWYRQRTNRANCLLALGFYTC